MFSRRIPAGALWLPAAQQNFMFYPYQLFFPSLMIALTMLGFTLLGDGPA